MIVTAFAAWQTYALHVSERENKALRVELFELKARRHVPREPVAASNPATPQQKRQAPQYPRRTLSETRRAAEDSSLVVAAQQVEMKGRAGNA